MITEGWEFLKERMNYQYHMAQKGDLARTGMFPGGP